MLDKRNLTMTASVVVLAAALAAAPASAQSFDTSGIAVDEALAARVPADIKEAGVLVGGSDNAYAPGNISLAKMARHPRASMSTS